MDHVFQITFQKDKLDSSSCENGACKTSVQILPQSLQDHFHHHLSPLAPVDVVNCLDLQQVLPMVKEFPRRNQPETHHHTDALYHIIHIHQKQKHTQACNIILPIPSTSENLFSILLFCAAAFSIPPSIFFPNLFHFGVRNPHKYTNISSKILHIPPLQLNLHVLLRLCINSILLFYSISK